MLEKEIIITKAQIYAKLEDNKRKITEGSIIAVILFVILTATPLMETIFNIGPKGAAFYEKFVIADAAVGYSLFARNIMLILRQNKALKQLLEKKKLSVKADSTCIVNYQTDD